MAKFITTKQITSELSELIKKAGDRLYIVSPYLKLSKDFRELLTYRNSNRKDTKIIFGKQELNPEQMTFLQGLRFVYLFFSEDLHAKCYINDTKMIITSMNLYDFSMINNKEMGILIDISTPEDVQIYTDAWVEIDFIEKTSKPFDFVSKPTLVENTIQKEKGQTKKIKDTKDLKEHGYCIRCGDKTIALNPLVPYCKDCYNVWKKYSNEEYKEEFCHICGKNEKTSKVKPSCSDCYKTNKNKLEFPMTV
jgi:phosphatidylserine/phosphatidylglycerophosphate/cardiolipin synthase-like enzyme